MPKSTYMYWQARFDREDPDEPMRSEIEKIVSVNKNYGFRRVTATLKRNGVKVNKKKVQRIMQKYGLQVTSFARKSRKYSSYKGKVGKVAKNRIRRRFNTNVAHQKITTDTTEFKYYEIKDGQKLVTRKLYLDTFMDMFNGEILSFSVGKHPDANNIQKALNEAIDITSDCKFRRTFHSDQGWAYQMKSYVKRPKEARIFQSMSRKGNCLDNSVMENFFGILKQEIYYGNTFYSYDELRKEIEDFIEYYNEKRIKEKLGFKSPVEFRLAAEQNSYDLELVN